MDEGTILRWLKSDGDEIRRGDELVEIETDKATLTYQADGDGTLEIVAGEGETIPVGAVIARLGAGGNGASAEPEVVAAPAPRSGAKGDVTVVEATRAQGVVARRMAESKATIPDFAVTVEVDTTAALAACAEVDQAFELGDLVVKAAALALREHPRVNASYRDGHYELYSRVNVGVAVLDEGSLVVPTIFDADAKPVADIAREIRGLAEKARAGTITPPELAGGTFTVADLGSYGVRRFTPIINPPQAAILGVGAPGDRSTVEITLVCDHRILNGADAARFLDAVRKLAERPLSLVLA
jgi:pyruvate dehydrogenase E2 component (dihydrolipoamide acetyltransferase)